MSDQTPRMPDFRWDQHHGLFRIRGVHVAQVLDHNAVPFGEGDGVEWEQLPADAVKLVPSAEVEKLRTLLDQTVQAEMALRRQFTEICDDVLDEVEELTMSADTGIDRIRAILDRPAAAPAEPAAAVVELEFPADAAAHMAAFLTAARGVNVLKPWQDVAERLLAWMTERFAAAPAEPRTAKHSHESGCCWNCYTGPDSHPTETGDPACESYGCAPEPREYCPSCAGLGDVPCAHGSVVEHREDEERTPISERARMWLEANPPAEPPKLATSSVARKPSTETVSLVDEDDEPVVEHQPAQDSEGEELRAQVERQHEINAGWVAYQRRVSARRMEHVEAFEDALGLPRAGRGYSYERMIEAAAQVRAERDAARAERDEAMANGARHRDNHDICDETVKQLADERDQLQARLDAALALHHREVDGHGISDCAWCREGWPCKTSTLLHGQQPTKEAGRG